MSSRLTPGVELVHLTLEVAAQPRAVLALERSQLVDLSLQGVPLGVEPTHHLGVLRTPPGAAPYFASAVDRVGWESILGSIAGDDTVLLITRSPSGGNAIAQQFLIMSRTGKPVGGAAPLHPNHNEKDEVK